MNRAVKLWLGIFPILTGLAVAVAVITATGDHESHPILIAVVYPVIALSFAISGLVAWTLRPENGTGRLLVLVGLLWIVNGFWESDTPVVFGLAELFGSLFLAAFVHLMLTFPEGRLASPVHRRLIAGLWLTALLANVLPGVFNPKVNDCKGCPENPLVIADRPGVANVFEVIFSVAGLLIFLGVVVMLVRRWRRASKAQRRILGPVYFSGGAAVALVAALFGVGFVSNTAGNVLAVAAFVTFGAVPLFFLAGLLRTRLYRAAARLLREIPDEPTPDEIQAGLRSVLGDPTLQFLTWLDEVGSYVDARGNPAELTPDTPLRVTTEIGYEGRKLGAIVHDSALLHERALLDEVVSAARIAMEKDRGLQALRRSEARNRALLDAIPDLMFRVARDGTYLEVKGDSESLIRPREELIDLQVQDVLPREVAERFLEALAQPASKGVQTVEYRLAIGGVERDFEARMVPSGDDEVVVIVRDFTERTHLESELARRLGEVQREQEFTRTVVNVAPIVLMICDEEGRLIRFNDTTSELFGHTDDETTQGRLLWEVFPVEDDREALREAFERVHPLRPVEIESRWVAEDGGVRRIEASIAHIIDGEGRHRRIVAGLDVTDLIEQREEARRQRDILTVIAAATPSLIAGVEPDGRVAAEGVNRAFADATGYDDDTAPGRVFWDLVVAPEHIPEFKANFEASVASGIPVDYESAWIGVDGQHRLVEWSCRPLAGLGMFLICGVDITERKRQEDEIKASRARHRRGRRRGAPPARAQPARRRPAAAGVALARPAARAVAAP